MDPIGMPRRRARGLQIDYPRGHATGVGCDKLACPTRGH
jgi:hypothetical protein